jgi:hypothetical protein
MVIRGKLAFENDALGMHRSTMIVPERTMHRFDQFSRSVNGIVNLRAPVEWFGPLPRRLPKAMIRTMWC